MPEEEPLQGFVAFELVGETEDVFLIGEFEEVEQLGAGFHDREGRVLAVVDDDGDAAWGCWCKLVGRGGKEEGGSAGVPLGSSLRNQSFFCSLVMMLLLGRQYPVVVFARGFRLAVHLGHGPLCAVDGLELFEHDLDFLAVGRVHRNEVKTLVNHGFSVIPLQRSPA